MKNLICKELNSNSGKEGRGKSTQMSRIYIIVILARKLLQKLPKRKYEKFNWKVTELKL